MKISVIIVTMNRKNELRDTLNAFIRQTYPDKEIIVIDNASSDGTREMVTNEFPMLQYLWLPENFDTRSINIGVSMSSGDIIWRTDDDSYPESEFAFEEVVQIFTKFPNIDIIATEDIEVVDNFTIYDWYPLKIDKDKIPEYGFKSNIFIGNGAAIRKKVFDKIGGFGSFGFEEVDFSFRAIIAGFNIRYFPSIRILHFASQNSRLKPERWIKMSTQYTRLQMRFFPFPLALGRAFMVIVFQMFSGIIKLLPISVLIEGFLSMLNIIFSTCRKDRLPVAKDKIQDITLGVGLFYNQWQYFQQIFTRRLKIWLKK